MAGCQIIVVLFIMQLFEQYTWKCINLDQSWADHAVAYNCWDMVMNQWSNCFILNVRSWLQFHGFMNPDFNEQL